MNETTWISAQIENVRQGFMDGRLDPDEAALALIAVIGVWHDDIRYTVNQVVSRWMEIRQSQDVILVEE